MYPVDFALKQNGWRLLAAGALSLLLHLALLLGIPVTPGGGVPQAGFRIHARLEPRAIEPQTRQALLTPAEKSDPPAREMTRREPAATAAEPAREPRPAAAAPAAEPVAGIELPFDRDPTYYPARQLDIYPRLLAPIRLEYPERAAVQRLDGELLLLLLIDEFGVVNEARAVESQPPGYFEEAALAVLRAARFSPAQKLGLAVKSRVLLQVSYHYGDGAGAVR